MVNDAASPDPASQVYSVLGRLEALYGRPAWIPTRAPLDELIQTVLSQSTSDTNADRAYRSLRANFANWEAVRQARVDRIADAIRSGGLADRKSLIIHRILDQVFSDWDDPSLQSLATLPLEEAKARLTGLPGVGPKTAACVLMFALGRPALPVDTHVFRVSHRLGIIPDAMSPEAAHGEIEKLLDPGDVYSFHICMITHGRRICVARLPYCDECVLNDICRYYANGGPKAVTKSRANRHE